VIEQTAYPFGEFHRLPFPHQPAGKLLVENLSQLRHLPADDDCAVGYGRGRYCRTTMSMGDQNHCPLSGPYGELLGSLDMNPQVIDGESAGEGTQALPLLRGGRHDPQLKMRTMVTKYLMGDNRLSCTGVLLAGAEMHEKLSGGRQSRSVPAGGDAGGKYLRHRCDPTETLGGYAQLKILRGGGPCGHKDTLRMA
jgi:hypothetical protein